METLMGQVFNPHLKKVLKTYQLSAPKSLQGPSTVLQEVGKRDALDFSATPPPLAIQAGPILTAPDRSPCQRCETVLEKESIVCFVVGGEKRLCLPQILNSILRTFTLAQINAVCDELRIFCSRCNPEQLDELKETGTLPRSAPSCGLITKTDAERLCSSLIHQPFMPTEMPKTTISVKVYHNCFGTGKGIVYPELYADIDARCIECVDCRGLLSPRQFVCHSHRNPEVRTCHWGFDSSNWRQYILLWRDQPDIDLKKRLLRYFKQQHKENNVLKQLIISLGGRSDFIRIEDEEEEVAAKKQKLSDDYVVQGPPFIPAQCDFQYYTWYEPYARSAFRPWHGYSQMDDKFRNGLPPYLNHDPPVLLHPERVVPMSDSERFERSYQPNVALAPRPNIENRRVEIHPEIVVQVDERPSTSREPTGNSLHSEIELSTDTDDSTSEHHETESAVEQVAVVEGLSYEKETNRQLVVNIVKRLAAQVDSIKAENKRLIREHASLLQHINKLKESRPNEVQPSASKLEGKRKLEADLKSSCSNTKRLLTQSPEPAETPPPTSPQQPVSSCSKAEMIATIAGDELANQPSAVALSDQAAQSSRQCDVKEPIVANDRESTDTEKTTGTVLRSSPVSVITSPASIKAEPPTD